MLQRSYDPKAQERLQPADAMSGETWRNRSGRFVKARPAELLRRVALLASASVFAAAPDDRLRALARRLRALEVPAGTVVLSPGEPSGSIFFISSGSARVEATAPGGATVPVYQLGRGDFFGEGALISDEPSRVTVVANSDLSLLLLDRQSFYSVLRADLEIADDLSRIHTQRSAAADQALAAHAEADGGPRGGSLVSVYSPKGGVGRSMVALNLAAQLAAVYPHEVVLLDLSFPFNHIALMANLVPPTSLARVGQAPKSDFESRLASAIIQHPSGLRVLATVLKNEEIELLSPGLILAALDVLRADHRYVIADLSPALNEIALSIFDRSHDIVVVVTPELTAAKAGGDLIEILRRLGIAADRISVALNNRAPKPPVTREALERLLHHRAAVEIGYEGNKLDEAVFRGSVPVLDEPGGEMARAMRQLGGILESHIEPAAAVSRG